MDQRTVNRSLLRESAMAPAGPPSGPVGEALHDVPHLDVPRLDVPRLDVPIPDLPRLDVPQPGAPTWAPSWVPATEAPSRRPATMSDRFLARLLDGILLSVVSWVPHLLLLWIAAASLPTYSYSSRTDSFESTSGSTGAAMTWGFLVIIWQFAIPVIMIGYHAWFIANRGQTPGKKAMHIEVVRDDLSGRLSLGQAVGRELIQGLGAGIIVGAFSPWFDDTGRLRSWADKVAGSAVVSVVP